MENQNDFSLRYAFDVRVTQSRALRAKYPERVPVIVQPLPHSTLTAMQKSKYLVKSDHTLGHLQCSVRKDIIGIGPEFAIVCFIDTSMRDWIQPAENKQFMLLPVSHLMSALDQQYAKPD